MSEQQPWQPPQLPQPQPSPGWPPPNPYSYPPPQNAYAAPPQNPYAAPAYGHPPHTYGSPSPSPYSYAPPQGAHHGRNLLIGGIVVALVVTVVAVEAVVAGHPRSSTAATPPSAPAQTNQATQSNPTTRSNPTTPPSLGPTSDGVTASSPLTPMSGIEVYSDDFTDSTSGWSDGTDPKGAVFAYSPTGYTVTSTVAAHWLAFAPYDEPAQQVNLNMTAHESAGAPTGAGFGVMCQRGPDSTSMVRYEFIVNETNRWFIERNQGAVSLSAPIPTILDEGSLPATLGTQELEVSGICATLADGQTTRLALFVGSQKVADITDVANLDGDGWLGGLISSGDDMKSTTTVAGYTESDLGNDGILAANT